jgi:hypothetical protein
LQLVAVAGLLVAAGIILLMPVGEAVAPKRAAAEPGAAGRGGLLWLFSIGVLATAATALTALAIIPLAFALARHLAPDPPENSTRCRA